MKIGFDNEKYLKMQSEHIRQRIEQFDHKLYLEFGGKLFDDYHASRVLPGFQPDSKLQMLKQLSSQAERCRCPGRSGRGRRSRCFGSGTGSSGRDQYR